MRNEKKRWKSVWNVLALAAICAIVIWGIAWILAWREEAFAQLAELCRMAVGGSPQMEQLLLSELKQYQQLCFLAAAAGIGVGGCGFFFLFCQRDRCRRRTEELTAYLERVNTGLPGTLMAEKEDDFSRLQDEIYKTVTGLYQTREEAVRAKSSFADNLANIAHQIKTPITSMSLSLQLMEQSASNPYIGSAAKQLERMTRLEEALLTLSRLDAGALPLERKRVDLYTALNLAGDHLEDFLRQRHLSLDIPDQGCVEIEGDLEWTMEALMNLMKNCMEHSPEGGCIHCDYTQNPLYAEILIRDEGKGFAKEDLPRLFERFYRGGGAAGDGIGVGLSLARSIFELQNGTVTARNLPEGGACFVVRVYCH